MSVVAYSVIRCCLNSVQQAGKLAGDQGVSVRLATLSSPEIARVCANEHLQIKKLVQLTLWAVQLCLYTLKKLILSRH